MLHEILKQKQREVAEARLVRPVAELERAVCDLPPCRPFARALAESPRPVAVIAEVKKASPSKGLIRSDFDPQAIARAYRTAEVDAVSVLTERAFFQGASEHLATVKAEVTCPVLRKDFLIDSWQVFESRLLGADAVLLIAAALAPNELKALYRLATDLGMDVLVEVHDERELEAALGLGCPLIGINNRNLRTFVTDLAVTERLVAQIPDGVTVVSESGISTPSDVARLRALGVRAVLVGEHFMRQADIARAVVELVGPAGVRT
jgi:Indole-3-glycerol phosphate synthase